MEADWRMVYDSEEDDDRWPENPGIWPKIPDKWWHNVETEVLRRIFSSPLFGHPEYSALRRVCKRWRDNVDVTAVRIPCQNGDQFCQNGWTTCFFFLNPLDQRKTPRGTFYCKKCNSWRDLLEKEVRAGKRPLKTEPSFSGYVLNNGNK